MGFFDFFKSNNTRPKPEFDPEFDSDVREYIESRYGAPYLTQEEIRRREEAREKAKEKAKEEARRKRAEKKRQKEQQEKEEQWKREHPGEELPKEEKKDNGGDSDTGERICYSLATPEDRDELSLYADEMWNAYISGRLDAYQAKCFRDTLLMYMNRTGMTNAQIYKKANLSKSVFSSIMSNKDRIPKKNTVIALAIALELDLECTERLLMKAGYTFSNSIVTDLVVVYCINHKMFDIDKINVELEKLGEPLLGSKTY